MDRLTNDETIRLEALRLVCKLHENSTVGGMKPSPQWLIEKAKPIENYIVTGK
jgi:hypothetical protein